jgi:hypothetical protein
MLNALSFLRMNYVTVVPRNAFSFYLLHLFIYLFIYTSFNDILSNSGYTESNILLRAHNGLETIWGPVMAQIFIAGLSKQMPGFMVNKAAMGFSEYFGFSCQ